MKKILSFILAALLAACSLTGCEIDWKEYSYYAWANESSHSIILSLESEDIHPEFENIVLNPEEKHEEMLGIKLSPGGRGWKLTVLFDDGTYGATFYLHEYIDENGNYDYQPFPEGYNVRYNPALEINYVIENVKNPEGCSKCTGTHWTYTFTDEDYNAAVEYAEREN